MLEHLQSHLLGLVHVIAAATAIIVGTAVLFNRKATRVHRLLGRAYLCSMLVMNVTAMANFELYGRFGPFHWMVLASLVTVIGGYATVRLRVDGLPAHGEIP